MAKSKHYIIANRKVSVGELATICDRNPRHPEASRLMKSLNENDPQTRVQISAVMIQAIEENRELVTAYKDLGRSYEVRLELGDELNHKQPASEPEKVESVTDDDGSGDSVAPPGCCG